MLVRRNFLHWLSASSLGSVAPGVLAQSRRLVSIRDDALLLQFDAQMRCRVTRLQGRRSTPLTDFDCSERLVLGGAPARTMDRFSLKESESVDCLTKFGPGKCLRLVGVSVGGIEKRLSVTLLHEFPGTALLDLSYRNATRRAIDVRAWETGAHRMLAAPRRARQAGGYWTYSGATHADRRDWVQPVKHGFEQRNFLGMNAPDYGGGTPVIDVWRPDAGLALGHLETQPHLVSLPVRAHGAQVDLALRCEIPQTLAPGETLHTPQAFLTVHGGDYFAPLDRYRELMALQGLAAPSPPRSAYDPSWCAWGYERDFSLPVVRATLPKVQELGLKWAVLDDGWQHMTGDWRPDLGKFPGGEDDMKALVRDIHARGLKARLWIAPLTVAPGSDELHDNSDMLLLGHDGEVQMVSWWNSFYLCPAYAKTQEHIAALVNKIIGEWGFDGLKVDGQHLNGVAPCYNPAHRHAHPEDSVEHLSDFYRALYEAAHRANPQAVVEVCPCGTGYSFFNMPFIDQAPASDPTSSWQVRHKGKTLKALMGPWAAYAGDHVELSDKGQDFASAVGVGAVVSTKFTWPADPKPKDSFLLTTEREQHWRRWIDLYNRNRLAQGRYRGELYDIAFDKPETHAIQKGEVMHYAFYADQWDGVVGLRGLHAGLWTVRDSLTGNELGRVSFDNPTLHLRFEHSQLIEVRPA